MTSREKRIAKHLLDALHELDGGQVHALTLHATIGGLNLCSSAEFDAVLQRLDAKKYVIGIQTKFKGVMWNISDAGEAARLEM